MLTRNGSSTRTTRTAEEGNMTAWSTAAPAISAAFLASLVEVVEAFTIVLAVATLRGWRPAALGTAGGLGALAACAVVLAAGAIVHRPLSRVPENILKFGVGVMLSAFGVFWTGEGLGIAWPGADFALLLFAALFLGAGLLASAFARKLAEFA